MGKHMKKIITVMTAFAAVLTILTPCLTAFATETVRFGSRESNKIAITVDDCYDIEHVKEYLKIAEEYNIPITFFVIGNALKFEDSEVWKQALADGCEIGNHTWGHCKLSDRTKQSIKFQMLRTQQKVDELLGCHYPMQVMRPPFGTTAPGLAKTVGELGYQYVVKWDIDSTEPKKVLHDVQNGSIILLHARAKDVKCLKAVIPEIISRGYECVTVSELFGLESVVTSDEMYVYDKADTLN